MLDTNAHGRSAGADPIATGNTTIGNAVVIAFDGEIGHLARDIAAAVPADPQHELVVADLPARPSVAVWQALAGAMPAGRRGIRLVLAGWSGEAATMAGHWLAERLRRTVVVPDGQLHRAANGCLFVHSWPGSGWQICRPKHSSVWEAKRFPKPAWDSELVGNVLATGSNGVAEPIPAGLWIHPVDENIETAHHRSRLVQSLPCQPQLMTVVVGCPGMAPVPVADVAYVWSCLPDDVRPHVRFFQYGPIELPQDGVFGPVLARHVNERIVCYPGMPLGEPGWPEIHTVSPDGSQGWRTYAREIEYAPPDSSGQAPPPGVRTHWLPFAGVTQMDSTAYWYTPDAVIEIVPAGLWLRPPEASDHAETVRSQPWDHARTTVFYDNSTEHNTVRMEWLARDVVSRMPSSVRAHTSIAPSHAGAATAAPAGESQAAAVQESVHRAQVPPQTPAPPRVPPPQQVLALPQAPALPEPPAAPPAPPRQLPAPPRQLPAPRPAPALLQPVPEPDVAGQVPAGGLAAEGTWLRQNLSLEFSAVARAVALAVSAEDPDSDAVTDAVAVRLQLSVRGEKVDRALRFGEPGPHVPLARCAASGLARLPAHRGIAGCVASPNAEQLSLYREHDVVTDWGFTSALTEPCGSQQGTVDVLVWSMTGRLTQELEPDGDEHVRGRVLFPPGTRFKVLDVVAPEPDGGRGKVLLRELMDGEAASAEEPNSLDKLAATSLNAQRDRWAQADLDTKIGAAVRNRFGDLPGLLPR